MVEIQELTPDQFEWALPELVYLLKECVNDGASIGFLRPLRDEKAFDYWQGVFDTVSQRKIFIAMNEEKIIGSVQLVFINIENQLHRAEISKLIVDPFHRNQKIGHFLVQYLERVAKENGKTLITLDTAGKVAPKFYEHLGYIKCGGIPGFALDVDGKPEANIFYFKSL